MTKQAQTELTGSFFMSDSFDDDIPLTFSNYEDIAKRPRFAPEVNTKTSQILKLVSTYTFPEKHPCGKKGCHQPHNNGWLAVTTDNQETLIGSRCGKEWGGDTFLFEKKQLAKRQQRNAHLEFLGKVIQTADQTFARIDEIKKRPHGATWLGKALDKFNQECSLDLLQVVKFKAQRGETAVEKSRYMTKEERDLNPNSTSAYKNEVIGHLIGLGVFNKDLRAILMDNVWSKLKGLKGLAIEELPTPVLARLVKEANSFELYLNEAEEVLAHGITFFSTPDNFKLIKALDAKNKHNHLTKINWLQFNR
jgi:hypothetical protein